MSDGGPAARFAGLTLRARLGLLLGISAAVLAIAGAILFGSLSTLSTERSSVVNDIDPALLAARDLRTALVDQETSLRGFLLTGEPSFLAPSDNGQTAELAAKAALEPLAASRPQIAASVDRVRLAADAWQSEFATPLVDALIPPADPNGKPLTPEQDRVKQEAEAQARSAGAQERGRELFTEVRASLDALEQDLAMQRGAAVLALDQAAQRVWTVSICVLIGLVALGIVIAVALNRSVTGPIVELADEVRGIAGGDLSRTVSVEGTPEIERLAADIDAMRLQILGELDRLSEANQAIEAQSIELQRSNADLEQFAYVASHDLQEPLRKIAGFCQLLERRYRGQLDDRADEYIDFVVDGAKRMQDLINDLLSFSRVGRNTAGFEPLELAAIVDDALANLRTALEESGADIEVGSLPAVVGDRRLLVALFQNLIGNALKFRDRDQPVVRIDAIRDGERWVVSVADNGIGIDPEYGEQIFTIFQRLHSRTDYEGTGIGLALAKKIVEHHGGSIWLDDEVAEGATFRFSRPVVEGTDAGTDDDLGRRDRPGGGDIPGARDGGTTIGAEQEAT